MKVDEQVLTSSTEGTFLVIAVGFTDSHPVEPAPACGAAAFAGVLLVWQCLPKSRLDGLIIGVL